MTAMLSIGPNTVYARAMDHLKGALSEEAFPHLDRGGRAAASASSRPRPIVLVTVGASVGLSWVVLILLASRQAALDPAAGGPGSTVLAQLPLPQLPAAWNGFVALCAGPAPLAGSGGEVFLALCAMWILMLIATMVPSAAPLIRVYCEIADTAAARGRPAAHPLVLVGGFGSALTLAATILAAATMLLQKGLGEGVPFTPLGGVAGAAALAIAGIYQFSPARNACLEKCRNPFGVLFARWSSRGTAIFRLGFDHGIWCLGCCFGLMAAMLPIGAMNVMWMAVMAVFAVLEKQLSGRIPGRISGAILLVWSAALLLIST